MPVSVSCPSRSQVRDVRLATAVGAGGASRLKGFGYVQFASEVAARKAATAAAEASLVLGEDARVLSMRARGMPRDRPTLPAAWAFRNAPPGAVTCCWLSVRGG